MKVLVIVALFAFVAVQVCHSAPIPDDEKVEVSEKKDEAAAAVPSDKAEPAAAADAAQADAEPKADEAVPKAADPASPAILVEEKKD